MEATSSVTFVIGAPGAGKGTLCKKLASECGLKHVSVGDTLRKAVQSANVDQAVVKCVQGSELLPTELLFSVLRPHLLSDKGGQAGGILLDGFPRRLDQAKSFEEVVSNPVPDEWWQTTPDPFKFGRPQLVLFFDCPADLAEDRVVQRLAGREGDNHETFRKRYAEFSELNPPVLAHYHNQGKLVQIDTSGTTKSSYAKLMDVLRARHEWGL